MPQPKQTYIIMRHGIAEDHHPEGDRSRRLTLAGESGVAKVAEQIKSYCDEQALSLQQIEHSSYTRTTSTAKLLAAIFDDDNGLKIEPNDLLVPGANILKLYQNMPESQPSQVVALVTHQPFISGLLADLVCGDSSFAREFPMFPGDAHILKGEFFGCGLMTSLKRFSSSSFE